MLMLNQVVYCWLDVVVDCLYVILFEFCDGEWLVLIGDNGVGKLILLWIMVGLFFFIFGLVMFNGELIVQFKNC